MKKYLHEYCVGCGLCEAVEKAEILEDENGYFHPETGDETWLENVCPAGGRQQKIMDFNSIWGRSKAAYYGWSADSSVRQIASSGGVLTEVASWLLENHSVDGIIHTCADPENPTSTVSCISTTREELIDRSGSRYAISHPLRILSSLDKTKKYAFIGKPCDVVALKNYMEIEPEWKDIVIYTLSFFCAGLPSRNAQKKLLEYLECPEENLKSLRYRGDGWPGFTTAVDQSDKEYRTDYNTSWGKILGRDIMKMCRFCLDGIGEAADISCGDAWYLTPDKKPDFTEAEGRNVIFARTDKGKQLMDVIISEGRLIAEEKNYDDLKYIQTYQYDRRGTMIDKIIAMKIMARPFPLCKMNSMIKFYNSVTLRKHCSVLKGTILRIIKKKI